MKVLVTGATGFVGKKLVLKLVEAGHQVRIVSRNAKRAQKQFESNIEVFEWDPMSGPPSEQVLAGVEGVVNLMGEGIANKRWTNAQKKKIYNSRVVGTHNLIAGLKKYSLSTLRVFVGASAIGIYPRNTDQVLTIDSPVGEGFLAEVCRDWENESLALKDTVRTVVVRIGVVLGSDGGALEKMLPIFKLGAGGPVGSGRQMMSWIHRDDLVRMLIFCLGTDSLSGPINGTAPNPVSNKQFSKILGMVLGRPAFMPAPAIALKVVLGEMSSIVLDSQNVIPGPVQTHGFKFAYPDLKSALEDACHVKQLSPLKKKSVA